MAPLGDVAAHAVKAAVDAVALAGVGLVGMHGLDQVVRRKHGLGRFCQSGQGKAYWGRWRH